MSCRACAVIQKIGRVALNVLEGIDQIGNVLLLGTPRETISRRIARARAAGKHWAVFACHLFMMRDHCTWSLEVEPQREVWHWSPPEAD